MKNTNKQPAVSPSPLEMAAVTSHRDYHYALIIGFIIGIFLYPIERNLGWTTNTPFVYTASLFGMPLLALLGITIARALVSRFALLWQLAKFGLVGVSNTVIYFGVYNFLLFVTNANSSSPKAFLALFSAVSFLASLINSYIWNSHWSFTGKSSRTVREFEEFFLVTLIGLLINSGITYLVGRAEPATISYRLWVNIAALCGTFVTLFWNFIGFRIFVFKNKE